MKVKFMNMQRMWLDLLSFHHKDFLYSGDINDGDEETEIAFVVLFQAIVFWRLNK